MTTMNITAAVVRAAGGPFRLEKMTLDQPRVGEVLVRIVACGICHTDISVRDQHFPLPLPIVAGHEGAGVIESVGYGVTKVAPGDHVVITFDSCGRCRECVKEHPAYCAELVQRNVSGSRIDGSNALHAPGGVHGSFFGQSSFASHVIATERNVVKVDPRLDLSLLAPLGCGIQTGAGTVLNRLKPETGASIAVFGVGAVGIAAIFAARIRKCATIVAIDLKPSRIDLALELGATHGIDGSGDGVAARLQEIVPSGFDFAVDTTANPIVMRTAMGALGPMGTLALLGLGAPNASLAVDLGHLMAGGRTLTSVSEGDSLPDHFIPQLITHFQAGRLPLDRIVTRFAFSDINDACDAMERGEVLKPVLIMPA